MGTNKDKLTRSKAKRRECGTAATANGKTFTFTDRGLRQPSPLPTNHLNRKMKKKKKEKKTDKKAVYKKNRKKIKPTSPSNAGPCVLLITIKCVLMSFFSPHLSIIPVSTAL